MTVHFLSPAFKSYPILAHSLIAQGSKDWDLRIIHDGKDDNFYRQLPADSRIIAEMTPTVNGYYGHILRNIMLRELKCDPDEYVIITNHDNYCFPNLVKMVETHIEDMLIWSICHNYFNYTIINPKFELGSIDIFNVACKAHIAKSVGWPWIDNCSDFFYITECYKRAETIKNLNRIIGCHN